MAGVLTYPDVVPLSVQIELERLIDERLRTLTEATVIDTVRGLLMTVIVTLVPIVRQEAAWWAAHWPATMDRWITQLGTESYRCVYRRYDVIVLSGPPAPIDDWASGAPDLETFVRRVTEALQASPAWTRYEQLRRELEPRRHAPDRARRQAARERVVLPWLDDLDWTPTKWAIESGVDPSVTLGYLAGTSNPRKVSRERLRDTLAKALQRATQLPD